MTKFAFPFYMVLLIRIAFLAMLALVIYQIAVDPSRVGRDIGIFFGSIVAGFVDATNGGAA